MNPSPSPSPSFHQFLLDGLQKGGFETEDVLAALLPLYRQVLAAHDLGKVAPLDGIGSLTISPDGSVHFPPDSLRHPSKNRGALDRLQPSKKIAVDVIQQVERSTDVDQGAVQITDQSISEAGSITDRLVFLPGYRSWEHAVGHHDELTDIFSLGLLLASLACGLDFMEEEDLANFLRHRENLFHLQPRLNPVLASVITQSTELNRHKRVQDLRQLIGRLQNHREQSLDFDRGFLGQPDFKNSPIDGKRRRIQSHLRDRLFEISRRNRLIHFKPTQQTLNLTLASVPLLLDHRNIQLEQLFVWHPQLAATIAEGAPMSLGKYLRFEDAPYISGVLDKILSEARRDRAEFGFAQLRLVLCFLRWHNLKEAKEERIHSPLLLLPVELSKRKGVRDNYVLDPTSSEAEVNPALRHHLRELYNLDLPESIDLKSISLDQFCANLAAQIQASEPGVTLNKLDRPQIQLIHEKARQRVDQYHRRLKIKVRTPSPSAKPEYSYDRSDSRPLGLQLFLQRIKPSPLPFRDAAGATPEPRDLSMSEPVPPKTLPSSDSSAPDPSAPAASPTHRETGRQLYAVHTGDTGNPYSWDFDLCNLTLGNFNYRKMTLVRDYANLIESDMVSRSFDTLFSLDPRPPEFEPVLQPPLSEQHFVIQCDATQASAVARARTGASYIIQGPPGTGKSQTITNLIADYVARNKRVLFVCEKRAAIDVVFHRLRQQGLDELCCLIHDSQTDKKAFIQNLKQTYEAFLDPSHQDAEAEATRSKLLAAIDQDLQSLNRFSQVMGSPHPHAGLSVRSLIHRLVQLRGQASELKPDIEDCLPLYSLWQAHGSVIQRLESTLRELQRSPIFATHPLRHLNQKVILADRPLETLTRQVDLAESLIEVIQSSFRASSLPPELWDTFEEIQSVLEFASRCQPLAERGLLGVLQLGPASAPFDALCATLDQAKQSHQSAATQSDGWRDPLSPSDTENARALAKSFEGSFFRFFNPAFYRLKKTLQSRYDFSRHAVPPPWSKLLEDLAERHRTQSEWSNAQQAARTTWRVEDLEGFRSLVDSLRLDPQRQHPSVRTLLLVASQSPNPAGIFHHLSDVRASFLQLADTLDSLLIHHKDWSLDSLITLLAEIRSESESLAELIPILSEIVQLPESVSHALRHVELPLGEFEGAMAHKSLRQVFREDRSIERVEGRAFSKKLLQLEERFREWLDTNARCLRMRVRQTFLDNVRTATTPSAQLSTEQKTFKKSYTAGRRDLEHEFGKTMRYKSIRELAAGDSGRVLRDLKPIWLMSPLSVSDTLPLDPELFDVVIFDEASQIPMEEAIPAIYRSHQTIVVGDAMQLPPTSFFATGRNESDSIVIEENGEQIEMDLDSDSLLTQSALNLPSTLLAWHYRSRSESLISFSNAAYYGGNLNTIPDRQPSFANRAELLVTSHEQAEANADAVLARSISFHLMENGVYEDRRNPNEALYIAHLVRQLLNSNSDHSLGIVAFSEAQQSEIESALDRLAAEDTAFAARLETEYTREENDVFCGLFVKNLENVQGDERDIILMSVCYGPDPTGRMLMNFGPINQRGGEKRLNVIFSRAKHHMAIVSSIRHSAITNDFNDGANSLKKFLEYAEAVSKGDEVSARRVLENLNPIGRKELTLQGDGDAVVARLAEALRHQGFVVDTQVGQSRFRCDLAVKLHADSPYALGILVDTEAHYANPNVLDRYLMQPSILRAFGWKYVLVLSKDWYQNPTDVLHQIAKMLKEASPSTARSPRSSSDPSDSAK